ANAALVSGHLVHVELALVGVGRDEEREALNVIPVHVAEKHVGLDLALRLRAQTEPELSKAAAAIADHQDAVDVELHARRIASESFRGMTGGGDGAASPPKTHEKFHQIPS